MTELAAAVLWGVLVALASISVSQHQQQPMLTDASLATAKDPDVVCIHVLTPGVVRKRNGEVNHT
jgi:hypothetical protein